jgi:hypothetical protein
MSSTENYFTKQTFFIASPGNYTPTNCAHSDLEVISTSKLFSYPPLKIISPANWVKIQPGIFCPPANCSHANLKSYIPEKTVLISSLKAMSHSKLFSYPGLIYIYSCTPAPANCYYIQPLK